MTNQEIFDLIACFDRSTAQTLRLTMQDFSLELTRGRAEPSCRSGSVGAASAPAPEPAAAGKAITAPMVGTFYAAPAPDQPPFVQAGGRVKKGQPLCLIEAMKMMSEIPAPCDCEITSVLKSSGDLVSFGDVLLRYKPC